MTTAKLALLTFLLLQIICVANEARNEKILTVAANHASFNADGSKVQ